MRKTMVLAGIVLILGFVFTGCPQSGTDVQTLPAPNASIDGSVVSWSLVPGAVGYSVRIEGIEVQNGSLGPTETSFDLAVLDLGVGDHSVTVIALGDGVQTAHSPPSAAVTFVVAALQLTPPVVWLDGTTVRWNEVQGATGYSVRIGGNEAAGGNLGAGARYFDLAPLGLGSGSHSVTVVALGDGELTLNSPASAPVTFLPGATQLTAPTIELDGPIVRWDEVPGATGFSVRADGTQLGTPLGLMIRELNLAPLLGPGSHSITVVALGDGVQTMDSPPSASVTFIGGLTTLTAPTIELDGSIVRWGDVSGAAGYSVRVDGAEVYGGNLGAEAAYFNLAALNLKPGEYSVTVVALGDGVQTSNSPASAPVTFTVLLPQLGAPVIALDGVIVSWDEVPGAGGYSVARLVGDEGGYYLTGGQNLSYAARYFDLTGRGLPVGSHVIVVRATGVEGESRTSPFSDSVLFEVVQLPQPQNIRLVEAVVHWDAVAGATGYSVRLGMAPVEGGELGPDARYFNLAPLNLGPGYHAIAVVALGDGAGHLDSTVPIGPTLTITRIPAPVVTLDGSTARWDAVAGATGYSVFIDGEVAASGGNLSYTARDFDLVPLALPGGDHIVTVVAHGTGALTVDSLPSYARTFTIGPLLAPQITLVGSTVSWDEVVGASGYSVRIAGVEVPGGNLLAAVREFDLAPLNLEYGSHSVTVVALGVTGQSLDSPASDSVAFILQPALAGTFSVTFEHFYRMEPIIVGTPIRILGSPAGRSLDITVENPERYQPGSIRWMLGARQLAHADGVSANGATLTLDSRIHGNREGSHSVTVVVTDMEGRTWSQLITFTVVR